MSVREDQVERPDGTQGTYGVVDKPDFALVIPVDHRAEDDRRGFWLVQQYRYPVQRRLWEFPQGSWAPGRRPSHRAAPADAVDPVYAPEQLARAELREETGLSAAHVRHLGHLYGASGFCSQGFDVYLATELTAGEPAREHSEQDMAHAFVTEDEFGELVRQGGIVDASTLAAYALLTSR